MRVFLRSGCFVLVFTVSFLSEGGLLDLDVVSARVSREMLSAKRPVKLESLPLVKTVLEGNGHYFLRQWRLLNSQEKRAVLDLKTTGGEGLLHLLAAEGRKAPVSIGPMTLEIIREIVAEEGLYKNRPDEGLKVLYAENFSGKTIFDTAIELLHPVLFNGEQALFFRSKYLIKKNIGFAAGLATLAAGMTGVTAFDMGGLWFSAGETQNLLTAGAMLSAVAASAMAVIQCRKVFKTSRALKQQ